MNNAALLTIIAASPALLTPRTPVEQERIAFHPAEGAAVTKVFRNTMLYGLEDMQVLMNGEENALMPKVEMEMETISTVTVTDTYGSVVDGRPGTLVRSYDGIGLEFDMEMSADGGLGGGATESPSGAGSSPLQGREVRFTWDTDEEGYLVDFTDTEDTSEEHLLRDLSEDMDVRGLLPRKDLEVGEVYDINLLAMIDVLAPGGDLKLDMNLDGLENPVGPAGDPQMMSNIRQMFGDLLDGEATGTLREMREVSNARIAVIDLDVEVDTSNDVSEMLLDVMEEQVQEGMQYNLDQADVEFGLEATGQLLWNVTAGHVHSLELKGDSTMAMEMVLSIDLGAQEMLIEMAMEMSGTLESVVETR